MLQIFSNSLGSEELEAIKRVLASKWLGAGPECKAFEEELGQHFGTKQVLLVNNCTAGIYTLLRALKIGQGDEVIISTANFNAIPSAVIDLGAKPVFADVDLEYFSILPQEIERLKTKRTRAVFILHYGGHAAPFDEIKAVCGNKIMILEDAANAVASTYKGKHCGTLGEGGVFSFDAMKLLVMGDGGALIMREPDAFRRAQTMRYLGLSSSSASGAEAQKQGKERWWEFDLACTSGRFISNDILASVGRVQLKKLPKFIERRKAIWLRYQQELQAIPQIHLPPEPLPGTTSSYYLYWLRVSEKRDQLAHYLRDQNIYTTFRYFPLHLVKFFRDRSRLPNAEEMSETALNIPMHQNLSDDDASKIIGAIKKFFNHR